MTEATTPMEKRLLDLDSLMSVMIESLSQDGLQHSSGAKLPITTTCHCCYRASAEVVVLGRSAAETLIKNRAE
jgi:hypothetical protein